MAVPPEIRFSQFDPSGISPIGSRHLLTHPSFVKTLSTDPNAFMDFGRLNLTFGKKTTRTTAVVAMLRQHNDMTEAIFNLKFWVSDFSDFHNGTYYFNGFPSGAWIQGIRLTDASGKYVPTHLPSGQNWWRAFPATFNRNSTNFTEITQSGIDNQTTMFYYLSVTADSDVDNGVYGGNGGGFTYRMTFDYR